MATQPVLCKGATSTNQILPLAVDSDGKLELSASGGLTSNITQWGSVSTSLGQKAKSACLPVTLANDEDDVNIAAAQLPASLGQKAKSACLAVTLANDEDDVNIAAAQLPASLGSTTSALSLSVTLASDEPAVETSSQAASSQDSLSIGAGAFNTSVSKDTAGYSKVGIIIESDQTDTTVQLEWSHDNTNWFALEAAQGTSAIAGINTGTQNTLYFNASPVAKYVRTHIKATTAASVEVLVNLH